MHFGTASTGEPVEKITLSNGDLHVAILTWGAIVQDVRLADVDRSLTLGSDHLSDYEGGMRHHGSLIGPIVNRVSTARTKIDGMMYELERNEHGSIHLHSGAQATHRRNWIVTDKSHQHVTLSCTLRDGACGLPGHRQITVMYRLDAPATLSMEVSAKTDQTTPFSFANHSYWNLDGTESWDGHRLWINADTYLPGTDQDYPTGEIRRVQGTSMDFRAPRVIHTASDQFDNNFCLGTTPAPLRDVLSLQGLSGVKLTMATTAPGVQVYDNKQGARPGRRPLEGLALEAQMWPDAPTNPPFPSILVRPEDTYTQHTTWTFTNALGASPQTPAI